MANPAVSLPAGLRPGPMVSTFLQAPLTIPDNGICPFRFRPWLSSLSLPSRHVTQVLTGIHPARRRFALRLVPASRWDVLSAQRPSADMGPPTAQSHFASDRRYRLEGGMRCLLETFQTAMSNPSSKRNANRRTARPVRRCAVHFHQSRRNVMRALPASLGSLAARNEQCNTPQMSAACAVN